MKQSTIKLLPLLIILFSIIGVLSWYAKNKKNQTDIKPETVNPSSLESGNPDLSPTPTNTSFFFSNDTPSTEPSTIPETTEPEEDTLSKNSTTSNEDTSDTEFQTVNKTITCTPVYGMADSCEEHIVVDTGAESNLAYSLSSLFYLAGLVAFIKSKKSLTANHPTG